MPGLLGNGLVILGMIVLLAVLVLLIKNKVKEIDKRDADLYIEGKDDAPQDHQINRDDLKYAGKNERQKHFLMEMEQLKRERERKG